MAWRRGIFYIVVVAGCTGAACSPASPASSQPAPRAGEVRVAAAPSTGLAEALPDAPGRSAHVEIDTGLDLPHELRAFTVELLTQIARGQLETATLHFSAESREFHEQANTSIEQYVCEAIGLYESSRLGGGSRPELKPEGFAEKLRQIELLRVDGADVGPDGGRLDGEIVLADGRRYRLSLSVARVEGRWQLQPAVG